MNHTRRNRGCARAVLCVAFGVALSLWAATTAAQGLPLRAIDNRGRAVDLALVDESLRVRIDRQYARTILKHAYLNRSAQRLEGRFQFRGAQDTVIDGFAYYNGEKKIVGEVFEKAVAREIYDRTVGGGRDPGLLEQVGEASFSFRVFPISAGERKRVELSFEQWLRRQGDWIELRVPVTRRDASARIEIIDDRPITSIRSATHDIEVSRSGSKQAWVKVKSARATPSELVLQYQLGDPAWSLATRVHRDRGHDAYLLLSLAAPAGAKATSAAAKDVTVVIDHSGSMEGEPLRQAQAAANDIIAKLGASDRLNVLLFDDGVDAAFAKPKKATKGNRKLAKQFVDDATDGGGTDIAKALRSAFDRQHRDGRPKVLMLITDGESDSREAIEAAQADTNSVRVFTIGVGPQVDKPLLNRLAVSNAGRFLYVHSAASIRERVATLWDRIEAPLVTGWSLQIEGARAYRRYPEGVRDLYANDELRIVSRVKGSGQVKVILRGTGERGPVEISRTFRIPKEARRPWVGKLWARERVAHLLEEIALKGERGELHNEAVELALTYNLITPYTSFLAIPAAELTADTSDLLASARARKRRLLMHHRDAMALQGDDDDDDDDDSSGAHGLDALCAIDPENCVRLDMDRAARRSMNAEMYAVQQIHPGGCAGCSAIGSSSSCGGAGLWLLLASWLGWARRRRFR